jgi:arylsulfatase
LPPVRTEFRWSGEVTGTPNGDAPSILDSSFTYTAEIQVPQGGAEGMILTQGGRFGGYGFYVPKGKPVFLYNLLDLKRVRWGGTDVLTPGKHTLEFDFKYDGLGAATLAFNNVSGPVAAPACSRSTARRWRAKKPFGGLSL